MINRHLFCILCGIALIGADAAGSAPSASQPHTVTREQAAHTAAAFVGAKRASELRYVGAAKWGLFPLSTTFYKFELPSHVKPLPEGRSVDDAEAPHGYRTEYTPGKPLKTTILVDKTTGILMSYEPDYHYWRAKYHDKPKPTQSSLLTPAAALEAARKALKMAGTLGEGWRFDNMTLELAHDDNSYHGHYCGYTVRWTRYLGVGGAEEVQVPDWIAVTVDALTGIIDSYECLAYPLSRMPAPAKVSREAAIALAKKASGSKNAKLIDAHLRIDYDESNLSDEELMQTVDNAARFYNGKGSKLQMLFWEVAFSGDFADEHGAVDVKSDGSWTLHVFTGVHWHGLVNAATGAVSKIYVGDSNMPRWYGEKLTPGYGDGGGL